MQNIFSKDLIHFDVKAKEKKDSIKEILKFLARLNRITNMELVLEKLLERELLNTTEIGHFIAIPHVKSNYVKIPSIVFVRFNSKIKWSLNGNEKVNMIFLLAVPEESEKLYLKIIANLSRKLMNDNFRKILKKSNDKNELYELFLKIVNNI